MLKDFNVDPDCHVGGDFNTYLHSNLDNPGGGIESIAYVKNTRRNDD